MRARSSPPGYARVTFIRRARLAPAMQWPISIEVRVPWSALDAAQHLNNAVMFSYFEEARVEAYFLAKGLDVRAAKWDPRDLDIILARTSCDYRSPAAMGETLRVSTWPTKVGETSFALAYRVEEKSSGRLVAEGESIQVAFDYASQRKKPLPAQLRSALEAGLRANG